MTKRSGKTLVRILLLILPFVFLGIFFLWGTTVILPVAHVELRYQYRKVLLDVFHARSIREVVFPEFRFVIIDTRYPENGLTIPEIFLDEPIIFNVDPNDSRAYTLALKRGIAHASGTGLPGSGKTGYYFAHSSSPAFVSQFNAVFYLLGKVEKGNTISVWHLGERFEYHVTDTRITDPTDVSFLTQEYPKETIILQTCWPPATTQKRLLVFAESSSSDRELIQ